MKTKIIIWFIFITSISAVNAQIQPLSIDQMNKRVEGGRDTTYIINFWATWCSPCVEELPYFEAVNKEYKDDKVKVMLVSLDFKSKLKTNVLPFLKRMKLKSEIFLLDESNQQEFIEQISKDWSGAIPATLFVNTAMNRRRFYEQEFNKNELEEALELFRKP